QVPGSLLSSTSKQCKQLQVQERKTRLPWFLEKKAACWYTTRSQWATNNVENSVELANNN
ncbi:MAG: hypothetical protein ACKPKO_27805, partial [Candidatus Fonsibacter sp.]